jgi:hypothetical protein
MRHSYTIDMGKWFLIILTVIGIIIVSMIEGILPDPFQLLKYMMDTACPNRNFDNEISRSACVNGFIGIIIAGVSFIGILAFLTKMRSGGNFG